jgi:hypothetical protein
LFQYKYGIIETANNGGAIMLRSKYNSYLIFNLSGENGYFANMAVKINRYPKN